MVTKPQKMVKRTIKIGRNTIEVEVPVGAKTGVRSVGAVTGLGFYRFLREIFASNEMLPEKDRLTDVHIMEACRKEFEHAPEVIHSLQGGTKKRNRIPVWRSMYNTGKLGGRFARSRVSFRYSPEGTPLSRCGDPLTKADLHDAAMHYRIPDDRFLKESEQAQVLQERRSTKPVDHLKDRKTSVAGLPKRGTK